MVHKQDSSCLTEKSYWTNKEQQKKKDRGKNKSTKVEENSEVLSLHIVLQKS